jgi:hypothetical protein
MSRHDLPGCCLEIARPAVIAQPLPEQEHVLLVGSRQVGQRRKPLEEAVKIRDDRRHLRLLKHRLADQHVI